MPASPDPGQFQITRIPAGERPSPDALAHGSIGPIVDHINGNAHVAAAVAKADAAVARAETIIRNHNAAIADALGRVSDRIDEFEARIAGLRQSEAERRDLDVETAALQAYALPPEDAPAVAADDPQSAFPHGELTIHPPTHPQHKAELHAGDDQGSLPRSLEKGAPPELGTEPELSGLRPQTYRTPAAISLA
jgi:hypothetical protein